MTQAEYEEQMAYLERDLQNGVIGKDEYEVMVSNLEYQASREVEKPWEKY